MTFVYSVVRSSSRNPAIHQGPRIKPLEMIDRECLLQVVVVTVLCWGSTAQTPGSGKSSAALLVSLALVLLSSSSSFLLPNNFSFLSIPSLSLFPLFLHFLFFFLFCFIISSTVSLFSCLIFILLTSPPSIVVFFGYRSSAAQFVTSHHNPFLPFQD